VRIVAAFRALWYGVADPTRIKETSKEAVTAVFAVAVLFVSITNTVCALWEQGDLALAAESRILLQNSATSPVKTSQLDLTAPQRQFTAALGGALIVTIVSTVVVAGLFMILMKFMTNLTVTFSQCLIAASAASSIIILDTLLASLLHVVFKTAQAGLHVGVVLRPMDAPMLFTWLQRISLFSLWQYLVVAIALVSWEGLNWRYGIVTGAVVWTITRLVFGLLTLVGWIVSLQGAGTAAP
jgi:hypothetical protein